MEFREYLKRLKSDQKIQCFGAGSKRKIKKIRKFMGGEIPKSYEIFLEEIGHGLIYGWEFNGIGLARVPSVISKTKLWQETDKELPESYLIISEVGDEVTWHMDISRKNAYGEYPIVGWISGLSKEEQPAWLKDQEWYESFERYFRTKARV